MKTASEASVGDTFYHVGQKVEELPGFQPAQSMVFAGIFPVDTSDFRRLDESITKLTLNDASVSVHKETRLVPIYVICNDGSFTLCTSSCAGARLASWIPRNVAYGCIPSKTGKCKHVYRKIKVVLTFSCNRNTKQILLLPSQRCHIEVSCQI